MAKRLNDDEAMEAAYKRLFGDLDGIESHGLFDDSADAVSGTAENAEPASEGSGGIKITVEPLMKAAEESGRMTDFNRDGEDDEKKDRLKGIGGMSPLMAQLHGKR